MAPVSPDEVVRKKRIHPRAALAHRLRVAQAEAAKPDLPERKRDEQRMGLRRLVRVFYDLQRLRLQSAGRVYERGTEIHLHPHDVVMLAERALELFDAERHALGDVQKALDAIPFYRDVILADKEHYRGLGPAMAAVILSEFDFARQETVSETWSYAGLQPIPCWRCKACNTVVHPEDSPLPYVLPDRVEVRGTTRNRWVRRPESDAGWLHMVPAARKRPPRPGAKPGKEEKVPPCPYGDRQTVVLASDQIYASAMTMRPMPGIPLPYNAWLRTKLLGVFGPVVLKAQGPLCRPYYEYKARKEAAGWGRTQNHRHLAAIRYMVKLAIADLQTSWRRYHGLPVRPSYSEEKLGHVHGGTPRPAVAADAPSPPAAAAEDDRPQHRSLVDDEVEAELEMALQVGSDHAGEVEPDYYALDDEPDSGPSVIDAE